MIILVVFILTFAAAGENGWSKGTSARNAYTYDSVSECNKARERLIQLVKREVAGITLISTCATPNEPSEFNAYLKDKQTTPTPNTITPGRDSS